MHLRQTPNSVKLHCTCSLFFYLRYMSKIFLTGIGTDVGKTIVSAIVCEALNADYWKPIQTGAEDNPDVATVQRYITNSKTFCHPSSVCLRLPASPNIAAQFENKIIQLNDITFPSTANTLVVEGAGGILVPINAQHTFADFVLHHDLPVILVVRNYLGCINHTLLSLECLSAKGIRVLAGVFNGDFSEGVKETIREHCHLLWVDIPTADPLNAEFIRSEAIKIKPFIADFA